MTHRDDTLLHRRAVRDANRLVRDHCAFGDAGLIERLADLVERSVFQEPPGYAATVLAELRAQAGIVQSLAT